MELAHYATDKVSSGLLAVYQNLWQALKQKRVSLLELGVAQGGSLRFWADFFAADSRLYGVDLTLPSGEFPPSVALYQGDQNDVAFLQKLGETAGPLDIIIDDGSHFTRETRTCFETLWPFVAVGGWYVVEDWAVGYWQHREPRYRGMVELVATLLQKAPSLQMAGFQISLQPGQAYAAFRKGAEGWQA